MPVLFRVEQNEASDTSSQLPSWTLLGFKWIEVLAIEPWALGNPDPGDYGEWCFKTVSNHYICNTEIGLVRITADDFWAAMEEYNEYARKSHKTDTPPLFITAGPAAIVQVNSELAHAITGKGKIMRDVYSASQVGIQGPNAQHNIVAFQQAWANGKFDAGKLSNELKTLRESMRGKPSKSGDDIQRDAAIGEVAQAELAARRGDGPKTLEYLAKGW